MPLFPAKKEVFEWVKAGSKTIDVRKGGARRGTIAVFQLGPYCVRMRIVKKETGTLTEIVRPDNFRSIIPTAESVDGAVEYLRRLYGAGEGLFTAYYLAHLKK
jgi:ASC-1-like (ASCH) protein